MSKHLLKQSGVILVLCLSAFVIILDARRSVHGSPPQDNELKKQVASLTDQMEEQKKQLDSLRTEFQRFSAAVVQRDKDTRELITKQDQRLNSYGQQIGGLIQSARQQDSALRQQASQLLEQRNVIIQINARLRAKGI